MPNRILNFQDAKSERCISYMPQTSDVLKEVRSSPIRELAALVDAAKDRKSLISLAGGAPSLPPPVEVVEEIVRYLTAEPLKISAYTATRGILEFRRALAEDLKRDTTLDFDPKTEITATSGATEAIMASLMALVNRGDEVIIMDPTYLGYAEAIRLIGGKPVCLPVSVERGFQPDIDELQRLISPRTKAIILLSPDNPTGRIIEKTRAQAIVDIAVDHDFWIIVDETYNHIVYDGETYWTAALNNARNRTVVCSTFSKAASIPGFRLGYVYGPANVIDGVERVTQYLSLCPSSVGQYAAVKFLSGELKYKYLNTVVLPTYRQRRDMMGRCLSEYLPRGKTVKPSGAFYYFVDISDYLHRLGMPDDKFMMTILEKCQVAIIPGCRFGNNGRNHVRLTFVAEAPERIQEGLIRIQKYLESQGVT